MSGRGSSFGRYALLKKLRSGGMAELWLAEVERELVALKLLLPALADDPHAVAMFRTEAELVSALSHPGIVRALDRGEHGGRAFLALEYVPGHTLGELWPVDLARAMEIAIDLCSALEHVHEHGIVHRDVSPDNVLVSDSGQVKLIDFGVASRTPKSGTLAGNVAYSSPEQLEGRPVGHRADVFSLGVLIHELVTGQRLFRRETQAATLLAVCEAPIPKPSALNADLPPELDGLLASALERDPSRRTPSAAELARGLVAIAR